VRDTHPEVHTVVHIHHPEVNTVVHIQHPEVNPVRDTHTLRYTR